MLKELEKQQAIYVANKISVPLLTRLYHFVMCWNIVVNYFCGFIG